MLAIKIPVQLFPIGSLCQQEKRVDHRYPYLNGPHFLLTMKEEKYKKMSNEVKKDDVLTKYGTPTFNVQYPESYRSQIKDSTIMKSGPPIDVNLLQRWSKWGLPHHQSIRSARRGTEELFFWWGRVATPDHQPSALVFQVLVSPK